MMKLKYQLFLLYLLSIIVLYPVIAQVLMYQIGCLVDKLPHGQIWVFIQIFISGPILLLIGSMLLVKYKGVLNKIFGTVSVIIAIFWVNILISDIVKEAA